MSRDLSIDVNNHRSELLNGIRNTFIAFKLANISMTLGWHLKIIYPDMKAWKDK
jgi:hypothetical protein